MHMQSASYVDELVDFRLVPFVLCVRTHRGGQAGRLRGRQTL